MKRYGKLLFLCWISVVAIAGMAQAHGDEEKGLISPSQLARELEKFQIIDIRPVNDYTQSHIPTAVSVPLMEVSQRQLQMAGISKERPVVLYGTSANTPKKAMLLLEVIGYGDITILAGRFTHWQEDGNPTERGRPAAAEAVMGKKGKVGLQISPQSHDFGVIPQKGGMVSTTFEVKNQGAVEIEVVDISTSCGCTSAEMAGREIAPGGTGEITVFFDPDFHKEPEGRFSRTVFLQLSTGDEIAFKIYVKIAKK